MKRIVSCLLMLAPLLATGCGGAASIIGTVTFRHKPVSSGTVVVVGSDMLPYYGNIQDDGSYTVPKVPTGFARMAVFSPGPAAPRPIDQDVPAGRPDFPRRRLAQVFRGDPEKWFPLPDRYRDFDTSGLSIDVSAGVNVLELELD